MLARRLATAAVFAFALAVGAWVARPFVAASVAYDSQASALHFARLVEGRQLEAFISTTPKPVLTIVYGTLYAGTHDWRAIALAGLLAYAGSIALTASLVRRELGWVAWAFASVALTGSLALLYDAGFALATPWALLFVAAAGMLGTRTRGRAAAAGLMLMLAVLCRVEVLLLVATIGVVLGWRRMAPARLGGETVRRASWLLLIALAALPVMALHDWLLTGDPLFWATVSARYSSTTRLTILTPVELATWLSGRYVALWPLTLLALVGVVRLVRRRRWALVAGVVAFGPGMAVLLVVLAARHIYVPSRYAAPIDLAAIVSASAGTGWLGALALRALRPRTARASRAPRSRRWLVGLIAGVGLAGVLGFAVAWPSGFFSRADRQRIAESRRFHADAALVLPTLRAIVDAVPGARDPGGHGGPPLVLVPEGLLPGLALDLDAPLTTVVSLNTPPVGPAIPRPAVGQVAFHDRHYDGRIASLEVETPTPFGPALAVPLLTDPTRGYWVVAIERR